MLVLGRTGTFIHMCSSISILLRLYSRVYAHLSTGALSVPPGLRPDHRGTNVIDHYTLGLFPRELGERLYGWSHMWLSGVVAHPSENTLRVSQSLLFAADLDLTPDFPLLGLYASDGYYDLNTHQCGCCDCSHGSPPATVMLRSHVCHPIFWTKPISPCD